MGIHRATPADWTLVDQTGGAISSGATWTYSENVTDVYVTGLGAYIDLMFVGRGLSATVSAVRGAYASVDNGATWYTNSGDYVSVAATGVETNQAAWLNHGTSSTAARTIAGVALGAGVSGGPKIMVSMNESSAIPRLFVASTSPVNAIRFTPGGGGSFTAGSIYVYAR